MPGFDAVALFAERAATAEPGFELTDHNKATVARICSKLDGLPLAIELAAARLRAISPEQILERLSDRYSLLTRGSRGAPTRQQTLSWSVGWSYDLCTPAEQKLWGRLSVFAGSFELEAAEDICDGDLAPDENSRFTVGTGGQVHPDPNGTQRRGSLPAAGDPSRRRQGTDPAERPIPRFAAAARGLVPTVGE